MSAKKAQAGRRYDGELQMFCDETHEPNREALHFMRWMAEQGRLEHAVYGPASGEYADGGSRALIAEAA
jgi:hypothetical protein